MKRALFVCTGNICRSPTAEGIARHLIATGQLENRIGVDSAGTHGYHSGEAPDPRSRQAAARRGYELGELRARKIELRDYQEFDLVLALDRGHLDLLRRECPQVYWPRLRLLMEFAHTPGATGGDVPDPYYGGPKGFELVLDLCEDAVPGVIDFLLREQ